ncbi:unnamed protein product [Urochloa humidicola]
MAAWRADGACAGGLSRESGKHGMGDLQGRRNGMPPLPAAADRDAAAAVGRDDAVELLQATASYCQSIGGGTTTA